MKQKFTILLAIFALFATSSSFAGEIAVLDIEKIAKESKAVHDIQNQVSKKQEQFQKEITKKQESLESEQKKLEAQRNTASKEAFEKKQKDFESKIDELKELVDSRQATLKKASADAMSEVNDKMKDIISELAKERELTLIIPASQVVFSADNLDISDEVLERLNKKVKKIRVKF